MADSFCLIPSKTEPSLSILKKENSTLKADLEEAQKQLALAERTLKQRKEQDLQLRDSIMLARKEVGLVWMLPQIPINPSLDRRKEQCHLRWRYDRLCRRLPWI